MNQEKESALYQVIPEEHVTQQRLQHGRAFDSKRGAMAQHLTGNTKVIPHNHTNLRITRKLPNENLARTRRKLWNRLDSTFKIRYAVQSKACRLDFVCCPTAVSKENSKAMKISVKTPNSLHQLSTHPKRQFPPR